MKLITRYKYPLLLGFLVMVLFVANYNSGTFLLGWDNFNSEFWPGLAVRQALNAGWSGFRSFGLVAGLGYAADLTHALVVWLMSWVMPLTWVRYGFNLLLLLVGGVGAYNLFKSFKIKPVYAFLGSLYYMVNFGTVQIFGLAYEPFSMFFAFFPWVIWAWFRVMGQWNRRNLAIFLLVNWLLSGSFYVQTMFLVYLLFAGVLVGVFVWGKRGSFKQFLGKLTLLMGIIVAVNSYWLLTQGYFLVDSVGVVREAKQVILGWRVPFYENVARSSWWDFLTQQGQYIDFVGREGEMMFAAWIAHFKKYPVIVFQAVVVALILLGVLEGKNKHKKYWLAFLGINVVALLMALPGLKQVNALLRLISIIDQIFRSPFSKFSVSLSLVFGYFLVLGVKVLVRRLGKRSVKVVLGGVILALMVVSCPIFKGDFFSKALKVKLPVEYFELFDYFKGVDKNKRIALLPEVNVWGWYVYDWGYLGSGFLWHGIEQPIVSRSYDVWSRDSENYFWEIGTALLKEDERAIYRVFEKYNLSYVIVDEWLVPYSSKELYLQTDRTRQILDESDWAEKVLDLGKLEVYQVDLAFDRGEFLLVDGLDNIGAEANSINEDVVYAHHGIYQTDESSGFDYYYPFLGLQSYSLDLDRNWDIKDKGDHFEVEALLPGKVIKDGALVADTSEKFTLPFEEAYEEVEMPVSFEVLDKRLVVSFPKIVLGYQNLTNVENCSGDEFYVNEGNVLSGEVDGGLRVVTRNGARACWGYHYDLLSQAESYLLKVETDNKKGPYLKMFVVDKTKKHNLMEQQLSDKVDNLLVVPSGNQYGLGLSVNFQSFSFKKTDSDNVLGEISLYLFPEEVLKNTNFVISGAGGDKIVKKYNNYKKIADWLYVVEGVDAGAEYLVFSQAYDEGWRAYQAASNKQQVTRFLQRSLPFIFAKPIKEHVLVNNWQNGWRLPEGLGGGSEIMIWYWPQVLEYVGFGLLGLAILLVLRKKDVN